MWVSGFIGGWVGRGLAWPAPSLSEDLRLTFGDPAACVVEGVVGIAGLPRL